MGRLGSGHTRMVRIVKILYVAVDTLIPGTHGGSVHVQELCCALARRGHEVHLVAPSAKVSAPGDVSQDLKLHRFRQPPRFLEWTAVRQVRRIAAAESPDVLVERFYTFGGAGIWAAHSLEIPAVLEVNSPARSIDYFWRDKLDRLTLVRPVDRWRRQVLRWSDAVYTTSRHLVPPELQRAVTVVGCGVDVARFRPGPSSGPTGPLRCVYVSSFRPWHGAEDLVNAVALCRKRGVELRVTCIGRGPRWESARRAAKKAGLDETISFLGEIPFEDVPRHLADADVGLAPFAPASFKVLEEIGWFWSPIKIFEYLAAGLTVVTIDIAEMRALLPDTVGSFYTPGGVEELAVTLEQLALNKDVVRANRDTARALAESRYTWDHQAALLETILQKVVAT